MTHFYASDFHFGHTKIIEYCDRPFSSVDEMNVALIENWNATVKPTDSATIVGDICMGKIDSTLQMVGWLNGTISLVPGNHDRCWSGHKKYKPWIRKYNAVGLAVLDNEITTRIGNHYVRVCHFPYAGDSHGPDRYKEFRPKDQGEILVHGHVHDQWAVKGRQINVSVDVRDFKPISTEELAEIISAL